MPSLLLLRQVRRSASISARNAVPWEGSGRALYAPLPLLGTLLLGLLLVLLVVVVVVMVLPAVWMEAWYGDGTGILLAAYYPRITQAIRALTPLQNRV